MSDSYQSTDNSSYGQQGSRKQNDSGTSDDQFSSNQGQQFQQPSYGSGGDSTGQNQDSASSRGGPTSYNSGGDQGYDQSEVAPTHHKHSENEPLPGLPKNDDLASRYESDNTGAGDNYNDQTTGNTGNAGGNYDTSTGSTGGTGQNTFNDDVSGQGQGQGGYSSARQGQGDYSAGSTGNQDDFSTGGAQGGQGGKPNMMDKVIGKAQQAIGKQTKNVDLEEKGELRQTGGKAAAQGQGSSYD